MAPLDALLATPDNGAQFFFVTTAPEAPKYCAERSRAPRFCEREKEEDGGNGQEEAGVN